MELTIVVSVLCALLFALVVFSDRKFSLKDLPNLPRRCGFNFVGSRIPTSPRPSPLGGSFPTEPTLHNKDAGRVLRKLADLADREGCTAYVVGISLSTSDRVLMEGRVEDLESLILQAKRAYDSPDIEDVEFEALSTPFKFAD